MADTVQLRVFLAGHVAVEADGVVLGEDRFAGRQGRACTRNGDQVGGGRPNQSLRELV